MNARSSSTGRLLIALAATLGLTLVAPAAQAQPHRDSFPAQVSLPDGFQPEGIATRGTTAWFGSRVDGDIYRANLRTGRGRVISQGPGTPSLGLKVDGRQRLWVAGGTGGDARVVSARTGQVLKRYRFADDSTFVNDVILTRHAAWFTDSTRAALYRVPIGRHGRLAPQRRVTEVPLTGQWSQVPDENNANGITTTPDGKALLVVQSATGYLFRVAKATGVATRVRLGGALLADGDGLLREGRTLYAVQNRQNKVAVVHLGRHGRTGRLQYTVSSPRFDVPSTVARAAGALYLPNARFTTPPAPTTPYSVTRVELPRRGR